MKIKENSTTITESSRDYETSSDSEDNMKPLVRQKGGICIDPMMLWCEFLSRLQENGA